MCLLVRSSVFEFIRVFGCCVMFACRLVKEFVGCLLVCLLGKASVRLVVCAFVLCVSLCCFACLLVAIGLFARCVRCVFV